MDISDKCRKRWVVKLGSAILTGGGDGLDEKSIAIWVKQLGVLKNQGVDLVVVSSGAVAAGMSLLHQSTRPEILSELQATAAVGQMKLAQVWESCFAAEGYHTAQILLTHEDLSDRNRYLNARHTLRTLLQWQVIPIVNENDTVATEEIRFGDNDTLAALVTNLVEADQLVILTDRDGMYASDPQKYPQAPLIKEAMADSKELDAMAEGGSGRLGRGGMQTKLRAARLAARSGAHTIIVGGAIPQVIERLFQGESLGTRLLSTQTPLAARKQWLAGQLQLRGRIFLDAGAVSALRLSGKSLLSVGVYQCEGEFQRGEMISCMNELGEEIARGLTNYGYHELEKFLGKPSVQIESLLGYVYEPEVIHRDNLILM